MKIIGYRAFDFEPNLFTASLPSQFAGMPSVTPSVLPRPGNFPTFGPVEFGEMIVPVEFIWQGGAAMTYEDAYALLFKRLNPWDQRPGQLRAQLNDNTKLETLALMRIAGFASFDENDVNTRLVDFVCVSGWKAMVASTASATF